MNTQLSEFLNKLAALMDEYGAEFLADNYRDVLSLTFTTERSGLEFMMERSRIDADMIKHELAREARHATP